MLVGVLLCTRAITTGSRAGDKTHKQNASPVLPFKVFNVRKGDGVFHHRLGSQELQHNGALCREADRRHRRQVLLSQHKVSVHVGVGASHAQKGVRMGALGLHS